MGEAAADVVVEEGALEVVAERIAWADGKVVAERGTLRQPGSGGGPGATIAFERAEIDLAGRRASLWGVVAESGEAHIEAAEVDLAEGAWTLRDATLAPCACDDGGAPALTFRGERIDVVPGETATVHGGSARLFGVPVVPLPWWRVPLEERRFRLDLPEVAHGEYGWAASATGGGKLGETWISGGPAWRQDRGFRGVAEVAGPAGEARGELGWDALDGRVRGVVDTRGGVDSGVRLGWDGVVESDPDYVADLGVDYVARGVAWREARGAFVWRSLRTEAWRLDTGEVLAWQRLRVEIGRDGVHAASRSPWVVAPRVELGAMADERGTWAVPGAGVDAHGSATWGPVHVEGTGEAFGALDPVDLDTPIPIGGWGGLVRAEVPLWTEGLGRRVQWWPGVTAERGFVPLDVYRAVTTNPAVGPSLRAQTALGDAVVGGEGRVGWDGEGWRPMVALDAQAGAWSLAGRADTDVQYGALRWAPDPVTLAVGGANAEGLALAWGDAGVRVGRLVAGAGGAWDVGANVHAGADARLGYDDGCVAATITARFAPDREAPDFGAGVVVRR